MTWQIFPMFYPGDTGVARGRARVYLQDRALGRQLADYAVEGELRVSGIVKPFSYASPLYGVGFRVDPLSRRLFTQSV